MTAVLVMDAEDIAADRRGWLERRRRDGDGHWCVTASEIASVCNVAPRAFDGPYGLYWKKRRGQESGDSDEMRRGRAVEPIVLEEFAESHPGLAVLPGGLYARADAPWMLATLDGQAILADTMALLGYSHVPLLALREVPEEEIATVQVKTSIPTEGWGWEEDTAEVPVHVYAQVLWEMHVRGAVRAYVVVKFMASWRTNTYVVDLDAAAKDQIAWMVERAQWFTGLLAAGTPPPVDYRPSTTDALRRVYDGIEDREVRVPWRLALRYRAGLRAHNRVEDRRTLVKNLLLERAGNAGTVVAADPATGRAVTVASRTAGPRKEKIIPAAERVERLNPSGWARAPRESE